MAFNARCPAVKRLMREAQELQNKTEFYHAQPLEDNIFEWHFTIRGPSDTDFDGGVYHGRILLPAEYPMKPPSITFLTPNGRFRVNEKICLSISGHHPETWLPSWSIRTALLALIGFMPTVGEGAIGALDYTPDERKVLAKRSLSFKCETCGTETVNALAVVTENSQQICDEAKELASQIDFKNSKPQQQSQEVSKPDEPPATPTAPTTPVSTETVLRHRIVTEDISTTTTTTTTVTTTTATSANKTEQRNTPIASATTPATQSAPVNSILIFCLASVFLFLLIRRLFLIFNGKDQ